MKKRTSENTLDSDSTLHPEQTETPLTFRQTASAFICGLVLLVPVSLFIMHYDLMGGLSYGISGVPPAIPWFLLLLLLLATAFFQRFIPALAQNHRQLLLVFGFLALSIPIMVFQGVRSLLPHLAVLPYYAGPDNEFDRILKFIPDWLLPKDPAVVIPLYEGSPNGSIMWGPWLGTVLLWGAFMLALGLITLCMVSLVRHYWNEGEHLTYPMLELPRQLVATKTYRGISLLRDPLMWIGFGLAFVFHTGSIAKYFNPSIPAVPSKVDLAPFFTEDPLRHLLPLRFYINPLTIGAAYLVPQDILFSLWSIYLIYKIVALMGGIFGLQTRWEFPYYQEQSTGGYIAYGLLLLYSARGHMKRLWDKMVGAKADGEAYPLTPSTAVIGMILGGAFLVAWCWVNQFALKLAVPYFIILALFTLVQARIRAETGVPLGWDYPYNMQKRIFDRVLGTKGIINLGDKQGLVMMSFYSWLARYNYLGETAAFETDNATLWEEVGIRRSTSLWFIVLALVCGIGIGFVIHLKAHYMLGGSLLQGATFYGTANNRVARGEYLNLGAQLISAVPPDLTRSTYIALGFLILPAIVFVRKVFLRFPFHPVGFLLATCYGPTPYYWSSFMLAWAAKAVILRLGGASLYRRLVAFFLGLVLGSAMTYDVIWTIIRAILPEGMVEGYV